MSSSWAMMIQTTSHVDAKTANLSVLVSFEDGRVLHDVATVSYMSAAGRLVDARLRFVLAHAQPKVMEDGEYVLSLCRREVLNTLSSMPYSVLRSMDRITCEVVRED